MKGDACTLLGMCQVMQIDLAAKVQRTWRGT
jgi:hypothetical protein